MTPESNRPDLDQVLADIRNEAIDPAAEQAAANRVWTKLAEQAGLPVVEKIRGCGDFQALIPDYRAGRLPEARTLLFKDHLHECVACRKALERAEGHAVSMPLPKRPVLTLPAYRWAIAAALTLALGLGSWFAINRFGGNPSDSRMVVQSMDGKVYRVTDQGTQALNPGDTVTGGEIRTAKDSSAVLRLADGSLVEMRERSAFQAGETRRDMYLRLLRGSAIVEAAHRRFGRLYVATRDLRVAVRGTVFSVDSGVKGSRVSVLQGEVQVAQNGAEKVLRQGDQYTSNPSVEQVPVRDEIAWSRNLAAHLSMVNAIQKKLEDVNFPGERHTSQFLALLPANTVVYGSAPNMGSTLADIEQVIKDNGQQVPDFQQWWNQNGAKIDETVKQLQTASQYLGDELVLAAFQVNGRTTPPVLMAAAKPGLEQFIASSGLPVTVVANPASVPAGNSGKLYVYMAGGIAAASPDSAGLQQLAAAIAHPGGFATTPFGQKVAGYYQQGVGLLLAVDLSAMPQHAPAEAAAAIGNVQSLVIQQKKNSAGGTDTRADIGFAGSRTGFMSWLGKPGPMGALDYITPEAALAAAAVVKSPAAILDEVVARAGLAPGGHTPDFSELEAHTGINVRNDLLAPLGGEFAFAFDGPALPTPSWKLVVEVYDPARLQFTIQKMVEAVNREAGQNVQLTQETVSGRTYYAIVLPKAQPLGEFHYLFSDGYLVAAPNRTLLDRALQAHSTGYTLARSTQFMNLLPRDHYPNFSGVFYQNAGPQLNTLLGALPSGSKLSPEQQQNVQKFAGQLKPTLLAAYASDGGIEVATSGNLIGLGMGQMGVMQMLGGPGRRHGTRSR